MVLPEGKRFPPRKMVSRQRMFTSVMGIRNPADWKFMKDEVSPQLLQEEKQANKKKRKHANEERTAAQPKRPREAQEAPQTGTSYPADSQRAEYFEQQTNRDCAAQALRMGVGWADPELSNQVFAEFTAQHVGNVEMAQQEIASHGYSSLVLQDVIDKCARYEWFRLATGWTIEMVSKLLLALWDEGALECVVVFEASGGDFCSEPHFTSWTLLNENGQPMFVYKDGMIPKDSQFRPVRNRPRRTMQQMTRLLVQRKNDAIVVHRSTVGAQARVSLIRSLRPPRTSRSDVNETPNSAPQRQTPRTNPRAPQQLPGLLPLFGIGNLANQCYANTALQMITAACRVMNKPELIQAVLHHHRSLASTRASEMASVVAQVLSRISDNDSHLSPNVQNDYNEVFVKLLAHLGDEHDACRMFHFNAQMHLACGSPLGESIRYGREEVHNAWINTNQSGTTRVTSAALERMGECESNRDCLKCMRRWCINEGHCNAAEAEQHVDRITDMDKNDPYRALVESEGQKCEGRLEWSSFVNGPPDVLHVYFPGRVAYEVIRAGQTDSHGEVHERDAVECRHSNFCVKLDSSISVGGVALRLEAVALHLGEDNAGHYVTLVRDYANQGHWRCINDHDTNCQVPKAVDTNVAGAIYVRVDKLAPQCLAVQPPPALPSSLGPAYIKENTQSPKKSTSPPQAPVVSSPPSDSPSKNTRAATKRASDSPLQNTRANATKHARQDVTLHTPSGSAFKYEHSPSPGGKEDTPTKTKRQQRNRKRRFTAKAHHHKAKASKKTSDAAKLLGDLCPPKARAMHGDARHSNLWRAAVKSLKRAPPLGMKFGQEHEGPERAAMLAAELMESIHCSPRCHLCHRSALTLHPFIPRPEDVTSAHVQKKHPELRNKPLCGYCDEDLSKGCAISETRFGQRAVHPGFAPKCHGTEELPGLTLSEQLMIERVHIRMGIHIVKEGALKYRGHCLWLVQEASKELRHGLWLPEELPLWIVRRGEVQPHQIVHTDFIVRPDVALRYLDYKVATMPEIYKPTMETPQALSFDPSQSTWLDCEVTSSQAFPGTKVINVTPKLKHVVTETDNDMSELVSQVVGKGVQRKKAEATSNEDTPLSQFVFGSPTGPIQTPADEPSIHDGDGGAAGKNPQRNADLATNMIHSLIPARSSSLGKKELISLVENEVMVGEDDTGSQSDGIGGGGEEAVDENEGTPETHDSDAAGTHTTRPRCLMPDLNGAATDIPLRLEEHFPTLKADLRRSGSTLKRPQLNATAPARKEDVIMAPRLGAKVDLFSAEGQRHLFQKAFPTLVHNMDFDYFTSNLQDHSVKHIAKEDVFRYLLQLTDGDGHRPFAEHPTAMYAILNLNFRLDVAKMRGVVAERAYSGKTAKDVLKDIKDKKKGVYNKVHAFSSQIPGTPGFWYNFRAQTDAVGYFKEHQTGCPETVFYTITAAENWWPSFFERCLPLDQRFESNDTPDSMEDTLRRQQTTAQHVCLAVEYFQLVSNIFTEVFLPEAVDMGDFSERLEYQARTSGHKHGCGYIPNAPSFDVLQRALDGFQRFDSTRMPSRQRLEPLPEEKEALENVIEWVMAKLPITGRYPTDCRRCQPRCHGNKNGIKLDKSRNYYMKWKYSKLTPKQRTVRLMRLRHRFCHKHMKSYCMRPRKSRARPVKSVNKKTAERKELKCRFEFFFKVCQCAHCLAELSCDEHRADFKADLEKLEVAAQQRATALGKDFVSIECHCGSGKQCLCKCGEVNCKDVWDKPHVHVTRNKHDDANKRHFRLLPARNHSGLDCTIDDALAAFGCVVNIQFIVDPLKARDYVTKYMGKDEKSSSKTTRVLNSLVATAAEKDVEMEILMQQCLHAVIVGREYGKWETCDIGLRHHLNSTSVTVAKLNLNGVCTVAIDAGSDSEDEPFMNAQQEDIDMDAGQGKQKVLDSPYHKYGKRPKVAHDVCLYDWRSTCVMDGKEAGRQYDSPIAVQFTPHVKLHLEEAIGNGKLSDDPKAKQKIELWAEHRLMLFKPWHGRAHTSVKGSHRTYREALEAMLPPWIKSLQQHFDSGMGDMPLWPLEWDCELPRVVVHEYAAALVQRGYVQLELCWSMDEIMSSETESVDSSTEEMSVDSMSSDGDEVDQDGNGDVDDLVAGLVSEMDELATPHTGHWRQQTESLLADWQCTFEDVATWVQKQRKDGDHKDVGASAEGSAHVQRDDLDEKQREVFDYVVSKVRAREQFFVVIQGPAGCGKSHLYRALEVELGEAIMFVAPTGVAAVQINGATINTGLQFPRPGQRWSTLEKAGSLARTQEQNGAVSVLALDERSMLGRETFGKICSRASEIWPDNTKPLGGLSMILVGDDLQLPPVCQQKSWSQKDLPTDVEASEENAASGGEEDEPDENEAEAPDDAEEEEEKTSKTKKKKKNSKMLDLLGCRNYQRLFQSDITKANPNHSHHPNHNHYPNYNPDP